jgi:hypothetical protein
MELAILTGLLQCLAVLVLAGAVTFYLFSCWN